MNTEENNILKNFFVELFFILQNERVKYCILRNYETLPENIGNDIDLLLDKKCLDKFKTILFDVARKHKYTLFKSISRFGYNSYWFLQKNHDEVLHFDAWTRLDWKGVRWADEKLVLNTRVSHKMFYAPHPNVEVGTLLLKDLIQNGKFRHKYMGKILKRLDEDSKGIQTFLSWGIGGALAKQLCTMSCNNEWDEIDQKKRNVRNNVLLYALKRNPLEPLLGFLRFLFGYLLSLMRRGSGLLIVLVGPDGSGKSTISDGLREDLKEIFVNREYYHGHFHIIPELKSLKDALLLKKRANKNTIARPDYELHLRSKGEREVKPYGLLRAMLYVFYYSVDYFLGHFIVAKFRARGDLIIYDRYFYDYLIQPVFSRVPKWLVLFIGKSLPIPDLVVYLKCLPEEIHSRKPELTVQEIKSQQDRIESNLTGLNNFCEVNTSGDSNIAIRRISDLVSCQLKERHAS